MNIQSPLTNLVYVVRSLKRLWVKDAGIFGFSPIDDAAEQFRNTLRQDILRGLNGRFERGVALAKKDAVSAHSDSNRRLYQVKSANQSRPPYFYMVDLERGKCECPDHQKGHFCKHLIASHIIERRDYNRQMAESYKAQSQSSTYLPKDNQVPSSVSTSVTEEALELSVDTNTPMPNDSIIWGVIKHNGQWLGVELLALDDEEATIRALPKIISGNKLQPQFPFQGKRCTITLPKKHIFHVKIFQ